MTTASELEVKNIKTEEKEFIKSVFDKVAKLNPEDLKNEDFKRGFETATHDIFETIHTVSQANFDIIGNFITSQDYKDDAPKDLTGALEIGLIGVRLSILELVAKLLKNVRSELKDPVETLKDLSKDMEGIEEHVFELIKDIFVNNFSTVRAFYEGEFKDAK